MPKKGNRRAETCRGKRPEARDENGKTNPIGPPFEPNTRKQKHSHRPLK
jgi:hypothetical protein